MTARIAIQSRAVAARLRKLEAKRPPAVTAFLVWAETDEAAERKGAELLAEGVIHKGEEFAALAWPDSSPMPPSRRVVLNPTRFQDADLGRRELELLITALEAEVVQAERESARGAGEDVSRLDDTDFYIRHLRRTGKYDELRTLKHRKNPDPAEITIAAHNAWRERVRAWEMRYMPDQSAGAGPRAGDGANRKPLESGLLK